MHRPVSPAMRPRVSSLPASPDCAGDGSSSLLESRILRRCWSLNLRVAPNLYTPSSAFPMRLRVSPIPASSGCAGDGSSSFLESRILRRCRLSDSPGCPESSLFQQRLLMRFRVAPNPASSGCASGEAPGLPASSPSAAERRISGLPRFSHLSAVPAMKPRVAPVLASSSLVWWRLSGYPRNSFLQLGRRWIFGYPRISHPPVVPSMRIRASPNPASTAGPMMIPQLDSNFASSGYTADESSCSIGSCTFPPDSGCFLIRFRPSTAVVADCGLPNWILHRPARLNCVSNSLQGHQLEGA